MLRDLLRDLRERKPAIKRKPGVERLDAPLSIVMLDEISARLDTLNVTMEGVKARLDEQVPKGLQDQQDVDVSESLSSYSPPEPLFSADIKNDGDSTIWYALNDATRDFVELKKKEGRVVSMGRALINKIWFKCAADETSVVRVTGTF